MLALGLDTSSSAVTVAVFEQQLPPPPPGIKPRESYAAVSAGRGVVAERTEIATNRHGELLAPLIDEVLTAAGITATDLDAIGVGLGPGPFTGLRVGIMTAKAMGDALKIPVYGLCSLDVIATDVSGFSMSEDDDYVEHPFVVMTDARRKQVYWATYGFVSNRISGPEISKPSDLAAQLRGEFIYVAGAGALLYREEFEGFRVIEVAPYPNARRLASDACIKAMMRKPPDDLTPLYLRRPDAVPPGKPKAVTP